VNIDWQQMLTTIGGGTAVLLATAWLVRVIVSEGLAREAETFRVELQARADKEIEALQNKVAGGRKCRNRATQERAPDRSR
jgi:hypothetical protein